MNKELMRQAGFSDYIDEVEAGNCPQCKEAIEMGDFVNQLSLKEFEISGLCQKCQNKIFG